MTKIEWTDEVWNPVTGCSKVSQGCKYCYAERMAKRLAGRAGYPAAPHQFDVTLHPERLDIPLHWKKPRRVFVNSMSDLFHPDVPRCFIDHVLEVIAACPQHTFQVLTKRPELIMDKIYGFDDDCPARELGGGDYLPNLWLGVSVEDQATADERIPWLLKTPAAVRFVSYEPALGPIYIDRWLQEEDGEQWIGPRIDWVIVGGESGPGARPMHPDWAKSVRDQCQEAGVPFFFKQMGEYLFPSQAFGGEYEQEKDMDNAHQWRVGKHQAGRLLDGREWNEFPENKETK